MKFGERTRAATSKIHTASSHPSSLCASLFRDCMLGSRTERPSENSLSMQGKGGMSKTFLGQKEIVNELLRQCRRNHLHQIPFCLRARVLGLRPGEGTSVSQSRVRHQRGKRVELERGTNGSKLGLQGFCSFLIFCFVW